MRGVTVLNADTQILAYVNWQKAATLVVMGEALVIDSDPERTIRSKHLEIPFPRVVQLLNYVYVPYDATKHADRGLKVSKRGVLQRDNYKCAYCGKEATTVDHILPKSRGGEDTWENLVGACFKCNNKKDNLTPEEAGMKLLWHGYVPGFNKKLQEKIWKVLAESEEE